MTSRFAIRFGDDLTSIVVAPGALDNVGRVLTESCADQNPGTVVLVTDTIVGPLYSETVVESVHRAGCKTVEFRVPAGEKSKSLERASFLFDGLASARVGRDAMVLALGGGVVSDLAGFVAATWMRGIRFAICPTTLESAVDACLGGKTGINLPAGKNLVGAFHQPCVVIVDPACLATLDPRDVRAGMAESVKHALITSEEFFAWHEAHHVGLLSLDDAMLSELLARNLRIKGDIVARDVTERSGPRLWLNFGHTIGHAIETCDDYALRHGECVSLGMAAACRLGESLDLHGSSLTGRVSALLTKFGLPIQLASPLDLDQALAVMRLDKKSLGPDLRFVFLEDIGKPVVKTVTDLTLIRAALESLVK